jgi:hypothetical protein
MSRQSYLLAVLLAFPCSFAWADDALFRERVAPVLERRCLGCHNGSDKKGGLSLETAASLETGGDSGTPVVPGEPEESYLLDLITPDRGRAKMPKDADPLKDDEVAAIREWIHSGAKWPDDIALAPARVADTDWWSLAPLKRPAIPKVDEARAKWVRTPIDAFIAARHAELKVHPAPEADRRTLIRRLHFDLIGLPPTPEEIEAFVADEDPLAYEHLVDRLLDSPHYGERWARHWLDVVHFGETHGYDKDKPRLNAWPYRDYVIRSFNEDKPYSRFVEEQIAGDVLYPGTRDGMEALGFIAAGPWDFIGHAEVEETKIDGKVARHLDRDDMVTNTLQTFNSLTVQCAQCHNHKFDPILQEDYYRLQAVFAALDRTDKRYDADPETATRRHGLAAQQKALQKDREEVDRRIAEQAGPKLKELDARIARLEQAAKSSVHPPEFGYHSGISERQDVVKWVQVDLKESSPLAKVVLRACHDDFGNIGAGFGFPVRYKVELSDDPEFATNVTTLLDRTADDAANPKLTPVVIATEGKRGRYVRITAARLAPRLPTDFIFALAEFEAYDAEGRNLALGSEVTSLDSIEAPVRWRKTNLVDGLYPGGDASAEELAEATAEREKLLAESTREEDRRKLTSLVTQEGAIQQQLASLPSQQVCYVAAVHQGEGTFRGTGAQGGTPRPIHILNRGNVTQPGKEVTPGALSMFKELEAHFDLPEGHAEAERRAALARWLTDRRNPLTWRSIVNRVWQYHFGRGIVDTANDFGRNGQLPTHPELLDYLAAEFRDGDHSLKALHRQIVVSSTYRQSSNAPEAGAGDVDPAEVDADNRYLWKMNRRKLEAELVRDSVLLLSGKLDRTLFGPSFQDFKIEKPEHSPHYGYHLHDPEDPKSHRRSVYRFLVRSQPQPFMASLDCADPSMQVDKRNESLSALQALALLNNGFMVAMSQHFAARLEAMPGDVGEKVERGYYEAVGRQPNAAEREALVAFAQEHGLANLCRVLVNLNEFVFVD